MESNVIRKSHRFQNNFSNLFYNIHVLRENGSHELDARTGKIFQSEREIRKKRKKKIIWKRSSFKLIVGSGLGYILISLPINTRVVIRIKFEIRINFFFFLFSFPTFCILSQKLKLHRWIPVS